MRYSIPFQQSHCLTSDCSKPAAVSSAFRLRNRTLLPTRTSPQSKDWRVSGMTKFADRALIASKLRNSSQAFRSKKVFRIIGRSSQAPTRSFKCSLTLTRHPLKISLKSSYTSTNLTASKVTQRNSWPSATKSKKVIVMICNGYLWRKRLPMKRLRMCTLKA